MEACKKQLSICPNCHKMKGGEQEVHPPSLLSGFPRVLIEELRALGVLLGSGIEGAIAALNPLAELGDTIACHTLRTTHDIEVVEGE